jgi:Cu2+-exporting ATPase
VRPHEGTSDAAAAPRRAWASVFPLSERRLRICGVARGSPEHATLVGWLSQRAEVTRITWRPEVAVLYVEYDEGAALPGRFLRALRDQLYLLQRPPRAGFSLCPVHAVAGRIRLRIDGLGSAALFRLQAFAIALPGVTRAEASVDSGTLVLSYDPRQVSERHLIAALRTSDPEKWPAQWQRPRRLRWGNAVTDTLALGLCVTRAFPLPLLSAVVLCNMLRPLRRSFVSLQEGRVSVDLLDVAATSASLATGQPATAAFILWMVGIGDLLLDLTTDKARAALTRLMQLKQAVAFRILPSGVIERISVDAIAAFDHLLIEGGHGIAADGRVLSGRAVVDEKALTGESRLREKRPGDRVLAATIVVEGQLIIEVERAGRHTEAGKIIQILESTSSKPLTLQRQALDVAGKLVSPTFGAAALAAMLAADISRAVCVVITDFGTGIRIAVPTSALTAMTMAARSGVLIKGAHYLERLARADVIVFDKTGTLTRGEPEVVEVATRAGFDESAVIELCAAAEARHEHPVARALRSHAAKLRCTVPATDLGSEEYVVGQGLSVRVAGRRVLLGSAAWMGNNRVDISPFGDALQRFSVSQVSPLFIAVDGQLAGLVGYCDAVRPESAAIVARLKAGGRRKVVVLSGDSQDAAEAIGRAVGADEILGALLPAQKADHIKRLRAAGHVVAMVGDGINDAPALALADVGISISGSTELALEVADVVLREGGLRQLVEAFAVSDRAMASVRRNLGVIILPNATAIVLGALGCISPPVAAIINNGATILALLAGTMPLLAARPR